MRILEPGVRPGGDASDMYDPRSATDTDRPDGGRRDANGGIVTGFFCSAAGSGGSKGQIPECTLADA